MSVASKNPFDLLGGTFLPFIESRLFSLTWGFFFQTTATIPPPPLPSSPNPRPRNPLRLSLHATSPALRRVVVVSHRAEARGT